MEWMKLLPGTIMRCGCGGDTFGRVPANTIVWWMLRPKRLEHQPSRVPGSAVEYMCKEKRCGKVYLGIGVDLPKACHAPAVPV